MKKPDTPLRTRTKSEIHRLGDEIYEKTIRKQVEPDHIGDVVAIDVDSGSWSVGEDVRTASNRLRAQQPNATRVWLLRVGYLALRSFGAGSLRRTE